MQTLKVLSVLLSYPCADMHTALPELAEAIRLEKMLDEEPQQALLSLIEWMGERSLMALQEAYVELFDRGRKLSLHIFEHTHGESRDRGPAMIYLMQQFEDAGFTLAARELPDYMPLVLEFAAHRPLMEARDLLAECMPVLTLIGARLQQRESPYAAIFSAVEAIAGEPEEANELRRKAAEEGADESITRMDEIWEEEAVTFTQEAPDQRCGGPTDRDRVQPLRWTDAAENAPPDKSVVQNGITATDGELAAQSGHQR
jgi:nitrate reductase molybdenum cofactor assembly chaperone NarJ/NarW